MKTRNLVALAAASIVASPVAVGEDAVWGSLDASRINYAAGALNGDGHTELRAIIAANGDSVASGAVTITESYLDGVTVFYTSLLNTSTGDLSPEEADALYAWLESGGTLIVTSEYIAPHQYEVFTAPYGVQNYFGVGGQVFGTPLTSHPLVDGVGTFHLAGETTFEHGSDALRLGENDAGDPVMCVLEPGTGFNAGGRIFVIGDHNCFTNSYIFDNDNLTLATNMVAWAAEGGGGVNLSVSGACPGLMTADVSGATAGGTVAFIYAFGTGSAVIPSGPCAGTELGLDSSATLAGTATADAAGEASFSGNVPAGACGRVFVQALDVSTCATSNVEGI